MRAARCSRSTRTRHAGGIRRSTRGFPPNPNDSDLSNLRLLRREGREIEIVANGNSDEIMARLESCRARAPRD